MKRVLKNNKAVAKILLINNKSRGNRKKEESYNQKNQQALTKRALLKDGPSGKSIRSPHQKKGSVTI